MTPFELEILLHMYYTPTPPDAANRGAPILPQTLVTFIEDGLIEQVDAAPGDFGYEITERGKAYIEAVLRVPLPVQKWVMPEENKTRWLSDYDLIRIAGR